MPKTTKLPRRRSKTVKLPRIYLRASRPIPKKYYDNRDLVLKQMNEHRQGNYSGNAPKVSTVNPLSRLPSGAGIIDVLLPNLSEIDGRRDKRITARRLRTAMLVAGISLEELQRELVNLAVWKNKSKASRNTTIKKWIDGDCPILEGAITHVAKYLGVPRSWLMFSEMWDWWNPVARNEMVTSKQTPSRQCKMEVLCPTWSRPWATWLLHAVTCFPNSIDKSERWIPARLRNQIVMLSFASNRDHQSPRGRDHRSS